MRIWARTTRACLPLVMVVMVDCYELDQERRVRLERAWPRADGMVIGFPAWRVMGRPAGSQWLLIPWDWFIAAGTA